MAARYARHIMGTGPGFQAGIGHRHGQAARAHYGNIRQIVAEISSLLRADFMSPEHVAKRAQLVLHSLHHFCQPELRATTIHELGTAPGQDAGLFAQPEP